MSALLYLPLPTSFLDQVYLGRSFFFQLRSDYFRQITHNEVDLLISLSPAIFIDSLQSFPLIKAISFSLGLVLNVIPHSQDIKAFNVYS